MCAAGGAEYNGGATEFHANTYALMTTIDTKETKLLVWWLAELMQDEMVYLSV
jgi:hypothetical protein